MKICFFGAAGSFDYHQVGGMDSLVRRLALELCTHGVEVHYIHYDGKAASSTRTDTGLHMHYRSGFDETLALLEDEAYDHIFTVFVHAKNRVRYVRFRKKNGDRTKFHLILAGWPEQWWRRVLRFSEPVLLGYNGNVYCLSPRLEKVLKRRCPRVFLMLPPVPDNYFRSPAETGSKPLTRLTFMGRLDAGKGIHQVIDFFTFCAGQDSTIEPFISGYPWNHKAETIALHQELLDQETIGYQPVDFSCYSAELDEQVRQLLRRTDILFLPYTRLSSTIDVPLLVLEGMASLCSIITRPLGDLPEIYGSSRWMIQDGESPEKTLDMVRKLVAELPGERLRIAEHRQKFSFNQSQVARFLLDSLET